MANKKLRFYILTTAKEDYKGIYQKTDFDTFEENSLEDLGRHFSPRWSNLDYKDAVIVINTLSRQYEIDCSKWCEKRGLEYHITKSNGKPGRGKNAVVDVFEASNDDYCVPVDGDDYLTPYGVWFYKKLAEQDNPPDALCIYNSWMCSNYMWGQRYHYNFFKAYRDKIYGTEIARGIDVFEMMPSQFITQKEIDMAARAYPAVGDKRLFNPQQQFPLTWPK
jgi:hypothetical protein